MYTESISIPLLILLVVLAAILFSTFWLIRNFVSPLIKSRKINRLATVWLFRLELLAWTLFVLFLLYRLLLDSALISLVFLSTTIILGWSFWKDFIPGLLFRLENQVAKGDFIRHDGQESTVDGIGFRNLLSSSTAGETIITPYHKLNEAIIIRARAEGKLLKHSFTLNLEEPDINNATALIEQYILECPWSAPLQKPEVKRLHSNEFQVTAYTADPLAAKKQVAYLAWRMKNSKSK